MRRLVLAGALAVVALAAADRPNVIVILTDDQGYGDLSAHGNPILETPNLDKLHGESVRLTDFHVASVCTPTRSELMSGMYSLRNKASMVPAGRNLMRRELTIMPRAFADSGYATGLFGKWHLGDHYPYRPMDRGFQRVVWHKGWGFASEIEFDNDYYYTRYYDELEVKYSDRFCANLWFDEAMEWMDEQIAADKPFFTYLALNTPHMPFHAPHPDFGMYRDKVDDPDIAHFFGLIHNIDQNYARLDQWMREKGIRDDTILVYLNDNGTDKGETVFNAGMRGKKGSQYEGGHRAICFWRWPNGDLGKPRAIDYPSHVTDIFPTLADLAGVEAPDGLDGVSLRNAFAGQGQDRKIIVEYGGRVRPEQYEWSSVIWNKWRLVGRDELYDIKKDPGQKRNIADRNPKIVAEMKAHYDAHWDEIRPTIEVIEPVVIRAGEATEFTSNHWVEVDCEWYRYIANTRGPERGGVWHIDVEQSGDYQMELLRWPFHLNRGLTETGPATTIGGMPLDSGTAIPVAKASYKLDGAPPMQRDAEPGAVSVPFEVRLEKGRHTLQAWFQTAIGVEITGAYYVRIRPR